MDQMLESPRPTEYPAKINFTVYDSFCGCQKKVDTIHWLGSRWSGMCGSVNIEKLNLEHVIVMATVGKVVVPDEDVGVGYKTHDNKR